MTTSEPLAVAAGKVEKLSKAERKEKKKQRKLKEQEVVASDPSASDDTDVQLNLGSGFEEGKKKKKKDKKAKKAAAEAEAVEAEDVSVKRKADSQGLSKEVKKALKKAKLQNSAAATTASAPSKSRPLAVVGDAGLAASSPAIIRNLYKEHPDVVAMTTEQVAAYRKERTTIVEGADYKPLLKFEQTGLPQEMLHSTRDFVTPSPIQSQCWPIILAGHDLIGIAATGSGKTLGFGLPMMRHIAAQKEAGVVSGKGPFAIVMAPTRELALQISAVLEDAGSRCGISCVCVYGGVPKGPQVQALRAGVDVVVGTPGRLEDLMGDGVCKLKSVTYLVLDEADRMLDLGFEPHIRAICNTVRADRQTLMFSATWPTAVQQLASNFLSNPIKVTIGSQDLAASHSVTQVVEVIEQGKRDDRLLELMQKYHKSRTNRIIIFVLYKVEAPRVQQLLTRRGWKAGAIHGDISQAQRTAAVEAFKAGTVPLLIATDVAARGLDIPDVEVVINYSFPLTIEDYVHRIGRTGRAGKTGTAHTFFTAAADKPRSGELINVMREAKQQVPEALLAFGTTVKKKEHKLYGAHFKDVDLSKKATKITFDE